MRNKIFGSYNLQRYDKDILNKWGGHRRNTKGNYVANLQSVLKGFGIYIWGVDGDFGIKTQLAVKLFQWNAKQVAFRVKGDAIFNDLSIFLGGVTGVVDELTRKEIERWMDNKYVATGDLIRLKESNFSNIELSEDFREINHPYIRKNEFVLSSELLPFIKFTNKIAKELSLKIVLNQAMRVNGVKVTKTVVVPAKKSQHLIGHAIDCNIVDGGNWNSSRTFVKKGETEKAKQFIAAIKGKGLRWGGDFTNIDTPHFDKRLNSGLPDYEYKYYFNQRMISNKQMILLRHD